MIEATGHIEGDRIVVASKVAARLTERRVREGDAVPAHTALMPVGATRAMAGVAMAQAAVKQAAGDAPRA